MNKINKSKDKNKKFFVINKGIKKEEVYKEYSCCKKTQRTRGRTI